MVEKNEIEKVWFIEDNKLKTANKVVSKINYEGVEIAVLKTERECYSQDFLFKDKNNEYWSTDTIGIDFNRIIADDKSYCDNVVKAVKEFDLKQFYKIMIDNKEYFNLCKLKYISKYFPDIYENALECRNAILEKNRQKAEEYNRQAKKEQEEKVSTVNQKFENKLEDIKTYIRVGRDVKSEKLEFYKDNKYENGITTQNCFLYLANYYGIKIPLATQGFINNRLASYNFQTGEFSYYLNKNKTVSEKMHTYLEQIYIKVNEEFKDNVKDLKEKIDRIRGGQ